MEYAGELPVNPPDLRPGLVGGGEVLAHPGGEAVSGVALLLLGDGILVFLAVSMLVQAEGGGEAAVEVALALRKRREYCHSLEMEKGGKTKATTVKNSQTQKTLAQQRTESVFWE